MTVTVSFGSGETGKCLANPTIGNERKFANKF
jgi:hypothetical protein